MKNKHQEKSFDCMKWLRETRDRIYEETKDMTREERRRWFSRKPTDPALAEWWESTPKARVVKPRRNASLDGTERNG